MEFNMDVRSLPPAESDYDDIEAAILDTANGRWFLEEYVKRNRRADTYRLVAAIEGLERVTADLFWSNVIDLDKEIYGVQAKIESQNYCAQCFPEGLSAALQRLADQIKKILSVTSLANAHSDNTCRFHQIETSNDHVNTGANVKVELAPEDNTASEQFDGGTLDSGQKSGHHSPPNALSEGIMATEGLIRKACAWLERLRGGPGTLSA